MQSCPLVASWTCFVENVKKMMVELGFEVSTVVQRFSKSPRALEINPTTLRAPILLSSLDLEIVYYKLLLSSCVCYCQVTATQKSSFLREIQSQKYRALLQPRTKTIRKYQIWLWSGIKSPYSAKRGSSSIAGNLPAIFTILSIGTCTDDVFIYYQSFQSCKVSITSNF